MTNVAYCPHCGSPIGAVSVDIDKNVTYEKCPGRHCRMRFKYVTTDPRGFIIAPEQYKDNYIFARKWKEPLAER